MEGSDIERRPENDLERRPCACGCGEYPKLAKSRYRSGHSSGRPHRDGVVEGVHYDIDPATGCWEWKGFRFRGYAMGGPGGPIHRRVYETIHGEVPAGYDCHHRCENPGCINPDHMEVVEHREHLRRHTHAASILTEQDVINMRIARANGARLADLAAEYGIDFSNVGYICRGSSWPDVGGPRTFGRGRNVRVVWPSDPSLERTAA